MRSWATAAAAGGHGQVGARGAGGVGPKVKGRDRIGSSSSQKRDREGEEELFQPYHTRNQVRKQRKVAYGCSQVSVESRAFLMLVINIIGNFCNKSKFFGNKSKFLGNKS